jgi:hypothetical protein
MLSNLYEAISSGESGTYQQHLMQEILVKIARGKIH